MDNVYFNSGYLIHYGVKGQKHGIRRYQNEDGSLTSEGRDHYRIEERKALNNRWNQSSANTRKSSGTRKEGIRNLVATDKSGSSKNKVKRELSDEEKAARKKKIAKGVAIGAAATAAIAAGIIAYNKSTKIRDMYRQQAFEDYKSAAFDAAMLKSGHRHAIDDAIFARSKQQRKKSSRALYEAAAYRREAQRVIKDRNNLKKVAETATRRDALKNYFKDGRKIKSKYI